MPYLELMSRPNYLEARQKMQFAPRRSSSINRKVADGGACDLSKISLGQNHQNNSPKEPEVSAVILRNSDQRFIILTYVTVEIDENWTLRAPFAIPLQGSEERNYVVSEPHAKMDSPKAVSQSSAISERSHYQPDQACCLKAPTVGGSSATNALLQSQKRGSINNRTKAATVSDRSSQLNGSLSGDSSSSVRDGSSGFGSADLFKENSKVDKPIKKSRKKVKKKRKQRKKHFSSSSGDVSPGSAQGINGTSSMSIRFNSGPTCGVECSLDDSQSKNALPFGGSMQEVVMKVENEDQTKGGKDLSTTTSTATTFNDGMDILETEALCHDSADDDLAVNRRCVDERNLIVTTCDIQTKDVTTSGFSEEASDAHVEWNISRDDITSGSLSDEYCTPVLDSFSDSWHSDRDTNGSDDVNVQQSISKEGGVHPSDIKVSLDCSNFGTSFNDLASVEGHSTCGTSCDPTDGIANNVDHWSKIVDINDNYDIEACGSQGCVDSDGYSVVLGKKRRKGKKSVVGSKETNKPSGCVSMLGQVGKDSNHSAWKMVQKTDMDKRFSIQKSIETKRIQFDASNCNSVYSRHDTLVCLRKDEHENPAMSACLDDSSAQTEERIRYSTMVSLKPSLESENDRSRNNVSEKLQRKSNSRPKQEPSHNLRIGSRDSKVSSAWPTKLDVPQKKALDILSPVNNSKSITGNSRSYNCSITDSFNSSSKPHQYSQCHSEKARPPAVTAVPSNVKKVGSQSQISPLLTVSDSLQQLHLVEVESDGNNKFCKDKPSPCLLHTCNENGPSELDTRVPHRENSQSDNISVSTLQKWIHAGRKGAGALDNLPSSHIDDPVANRWNSKCTGDEQMSEESNCHVSFTKSGVTCSGPSSCSTMTSEEDRKTSELRYHAPYICKELSSVDIASSCRSLSKSKGQKVSVNETYLNKIAQVVIDAYIMQIKSEDVQRETGRPLAEFERFVHSASPVLDHTHRVQSSDACGCQLIGDSLCRHQIPNVSLGSLWRWFERAGSYGLEVKAEDYQNSKRIGSDCLQFSAYFVPFLSAVQLFGYPKSSMHVNKTIPDSEFAKTYDVYATSIYPYHFSRLPILSPLLPQSYRGKENDLSSPVNSLTIPDPLPALGQDELYQQSVSNIGDSELLFEYFESDQPQQRRPLFEKIQELVRGNATSNSQINGDPLKLEFLNLHDIHPSSWYSVAWYPIYRIPNGNFRAAFLTHHSLGHFISRTATSDSLNGGSIVSPVVGLQSYNAQGECWFQTRSTKVIQMKEPDHINASEVLKDRLRTLEQTAHHMARASFRKGDQISVNRQPDYEFFFSRRR